MIQSSFKYDGRVLVNTSFETNVEFVYAAGPVAKFVSNGFVAASSHTCYSSVEIGARVADVFMDRLDVVGDGRANAEYVRPLSVHCRLPGRYNYLHATVPGRHATSAKRSVKTLRTDSAVNGYFEIITNDRGDVLKLSCHSKGVSSPELYWFFSKRSRLTNDQIIIISHRDGGQGLPSNVS